MRYLILLSFLMMNTNLWALEVCAHRGARALYPENTLIALRKALELPIDCIDMDVVLSQDKVPIIYHDFYLNPDFTRDAKGRWIQNDKLLVKNLTFSQLQTYQLGKINPKRRYAKYFPKQQSVTLARIPSLAQGLSTILRYEQKPLEIQIELKTEVGHPQSPSCRSLSMAVAKLIYQWHLEKRSKIQSFDWQCLTYLHHRYPSLKLAFLTELKPTTPTLYHHAEDIPKLIKRFHGSYWDAEDKQLTKQDITRAHHLGLKVCAWSYAEENTKTLSSRYQRLAKDGIDCIISDQPDLVPQYHSPRRIFPVKTSLY